jgi:hypothetical protein
MSLLMEINLWVVVAVEKLHKQASHCSPKRELNRVRKNRSFRPVQVHLRLQPTHSILQTVQGSRNSDRNPYVVHWESVKCVAREDGIQQQIARHPMDLASIPNQIRE